MTHNRPHPLAPLNRHIGLYLQLFQPKCGVRFCETDRYDQRRPVSDPSTLPSTRASSCVPVESSPCLPGTSSELDQLTEVTVDSRSVTPSSSSSRPGRRARRLAQVTPRDQRIHLAVFATRDYAVNDIIVGCEGSFADLTEEEDLRLRGLHPPLDGHPDFSHLVNSRGKFQVFCGPARFVNHDCQNNVVLLREGFTIKFKVVKPIRADQEILTSYGANYFGEANCECMCATCEKAGRGFYSEDPPASQSVSAAMSTRIGAELSSIDLAATCPSDGMSSPLSIKDEGEEHSVIRPIGTPLANDVEHVLNMTTNVLRAVESRTKGANDAASYDSKPLVKPRARPGRPPGSKKTSIPAPAVNRLDSDDSRPSQPANPSRSSSLRRHQSRASLATAQLASRRPGSYVTSVRFIPTNDLTLPVYGFRERPDTTEAYTERRCAAEQPADATSAPSSVFEAPTGVESDSKVEAEPSVSVLTPVPTRRKTYWITSKQRQLGLLPWESNLAPSQGSPVGSTSNGISNPTSLDPRRYSSITPSLLGPSGSERRRLNSTVVEDAQASDEVPTDLLRKRKRATSETKLEPRLPKRSYWISTRDKQLGIVPWEPPQVTPPLSTPPITRATRSAQKAIQGVEPFKGLPSAPRGSRLNFRVIEQGTQEAGLLDSAIGRELLGFRPSTHNRSNPHPKRSTMLSTTSASPSETNETLAQDYEAEEPPGQSEAALRTVKPLSAAKRRKVHGMTPRTLGRKQKINSDATPDVEVRGEGGESGSSEVISTMTDAEGDERAVEGVRDVSEGESSVPRSTPIEFESPDAILESVVAIGSWSARRSSGLGMGPRPSRESGSSLESDRSCPRSIEGVKVGSKPISGSPPRIKDMGQDRHGARENDVMVMDEEEIDMLEEGEEAHVVAMVRAAVDEAQTS